MTSASKTFEKMCPHLGIIDNNGMRATINRSYPPLSTYTHAHSPVSLEAVNSMKVSVGSNADVSAGEKSTARRTQWGRGRGIA